MFDAKRLESSYLYQKRYDNFSRLIIYPSLALFIFGLCFLFFAKKTLVITHVATLMPSKTIASIKANSQEKILENYLTEGQHVQPDTLLVKYQAQDNETQLSGLKLDRDHLNEQKANLVRLQQSLIDEKDYLTGNDSFGYKHRYDNYQSQLKQLQVSVASSNQTVSEHNQTIQQQKATLAQQKSDLTRLYEDYQNLQQAIDDNQAPYSDNQLLSRYDYYCYQLETLRQNLPADEFSQESLSLKESFSKELGTMMTSLEGQLNSLTLQDSSLLESQNFDKTLDAQKQTLKSDYLATSSQELSDLSRQILEKNSQITLLENNINQSSILAGYTGILHLMPKVAGSMQHEPGQVIAEIYPDLEVGQELLLESYLPSASVAAIDLGQEAQLTLQKNLSKPLTLKGKINHIDRYPTSSESGNLYKVQASISVTKKNIDQLKYGLEGRLTIATGRQTYFDYYKVKFFSQD